MQLQGIILKQIKYAETSKVLQIFTLEHGTCSFILRGAFSKRNKGLSQNLSFIEFNSDIRDPEALNIIKTLSLKHPYSSLYTDVLKSSVALFLNEVSYNALRHEKTNPQLFSFLETTFLTLDKTPLNPAFPLFFLAELPDYLGFGIQPVASDKACYFDLTSGCFEPRPNGNSMDAQLSSVLNRILGMKFAGISGFSETRKTRKELISGLIKYLKHHVEGFGEIKSLHVLEEILN